MKTLWHIGLPVFAFVNAHAFNWPIAVEIADENKKGISVSVVFTKGAEEQFGYKSVGRVSIAEAAELLSRIGAGGALDTFSIGIVAHPQSDSRHYRPILQAIIDNIGTRIVSVDDGRSASMYREMLKSHESTQK